MDAVAAFLFPIDDNESQRGFGNAIGFSYEMPPLVVKESLTVGNQELKVADLR
jgi:hypothetical protein